MSYLARAVRDYRARRDPAEVRQALTDVEAAAARLSGIVPVSFEAFGRLLGRDPNDVRHWFQERHRRRVLPLLESQWMDDRSFTGEDPKGGGEG